MKKLLLFPLFIFIASCNPSEVNEKINAPETAANDIAMSYIKIANIHQAWTESYVNFLYWVNTPGETEEKKELTRFMDVVYPEIKAELKKMKADGPLADRIKNIEEEMEGLMDSYKSTTQALSSFDKYQDPMVIFLIEADVLDVDGECHMRFNQLNTRFSDLKETFREQLKAK